MFLVVAPIPVVNAESSCYPGLPCPDPGPRRSQTFTYPDIPTRDGNGHQVGVIRNMVLWISADLKRLNDKLSYRFNYDYYNGASRPWRGTWRGKQTVYVQLISASNLVMDTISLQLDRGHCVYGGLEPRQSEGNFSLRGSDLAAVSSIRVKVGPVSGVQTEC
jgi:hypothetical protein